MESGGRESGGGGLVAATGREKHMGKRELYQPPWNFLGLPAELSNRSAARAWVLPVPYEATTSYGAGTRDGPAAIIAASRQVELFDREFGCEPASKFGVHTMDMMWPAFDSPAAMMGAVEETVAGILRGSPAPEVLAVLGGEHSISAGVVRGIARAVPSKELVVVHEDAHADLRDEYEGCRFSHACAARRILEVCPIFQIGIRNISEGEEKFRRGCRDVRTVFAEEAAAGRRFLERLAEFVRGKRVYLTVDLDGLDPSIMPAVGTPEPGGLSWEALLDVARTVFREAKRVPVFDVVELAPMPGMRGPDFLAAKLVYKLMSLALLKPARRVL
ncbi:MAG: agmatinase [Planctomycetota bacterium]|nr:agmatinase [Planctomycetota bacterium]